MLSFAEQLNNPPRVHSRSLYIVPYPGPAGQRFRLERRTSFRQPCTNPEFFHRVPSPALGCYPHLLPPARGDGTQRRVRGWGDHSSQVSHVTHRFLSSAAGARWQQGGWEMPSGCAPGGDNGSRGHSTFLDAMSNTSRLSVFFKPFLSRYHMPSAVLRARQRGDRAAAWPWRSR